MDKLQEIIKQAENRINQLNGVYTDEHLQERINKIKEIGSKPVYVVSHDGVLDYEKIEKWDNSTKWTLSEDPNKEGWETDYGCSGYGLYPEVAEYYAMCINGYKQLLEENKRYKEALERLDRVLHFDREQETWVDEERLKQCTTGTEMMIWEKQIEMVKALNEAKRFAKGVLRTP